jgi:hypothetical protein
MADTAGMGAMEETVPAEATAGAEESPPPFKGAGGAEMAGTVAMAATAVAEATAAQVETGETAGLSK